jgi:biotin carboxylase
LVDTLVGLVFLLRLSCSPKGCDCSIQRKLRKVGWNSQSKAALQKSKAAFSLVDTLVGLVFLLWLSCSSKGCDCSIQRKLRKVGWNSQSKAALQKSKAAFSLLGSG